jgi:hypothetical protein
MLQRVGALPSETLQGPRHYIVSPVDFFSLAILQEIDDETADCILWCLGQVNSVCYFLHHPEWFRYLGQNLRVGG